MSKQLITKWGALVAKVLGGITALDCTSISPKYGVLLFMAASMLKDAIQRVKETKAG